MVSHGASANTLVALASIMPPDGPASAPTTRGPQRFGNPVFKERVEPDYTRTAARRGVEGRVVLQFTITPAGRVRISS